MIIEAWTNDNTRILSAINNENKEHTIKELLKQNDIRSMINKETGENLLPNTQCDNVDCKAEKPKDIEPTLMKKEFGGGWVNWCRECREGETDFIETDSSEYNLSEIQKKALLEPCPNCKTGELRPVESGGEEDEDECYLWCDNCLMSMDATGGYTK